MMNAKLTPWTRFVGSVTALVLIPIGTMPRAFAVDQTWTNSGGTATWSDSGNWSTGTPGSGDNVFLPFAIPSGGGTITLGAGSLANALTISNNYTLTGGDLTVTGGTINTSMGTSSIISSQLLGTAGLLKTGYGTLRLTNALNSYTGITQITQGSLVVTNQAALGGGLSTISILGNQTRGSSLSAPGFSGGQLVFGAGTGLGSSPAGISISRNIAVSGGGPSGDGYALTSVGSNTFSGTLLINAGGQSRFGNTVGMANLTGTVAPQGNSTAEMRGFGNWSMTGVLTGSTSSAFVKQGEGGTLIYNPNNVTGFSGAVGVAAGFIRVASGTSLGTSPAANAIRLGGGTFEIRSDAASTFGTTANPNRSTATASSTIFADRAVGSSDSTKLNQNVLLGNQITNAGGFTLTTLGRNGTNFIFADFADDNADNSTALANGSTTAASASSGRLTINGGSDNLIWNHTGGTTSRTLTFTSNADMTVNAGVSGANAILHNVTKAGTGELLWNALAASTHQGVTNLNAGTVTMTNLANAYGAASSSVNFGNGTAGVAVNYIGAGETSAKAINLNATTGPTFFFANQQTATAPLILSGFSSAAGGYGAGAKTLVLGGSNSSQANAVTAAISENSATNTTSILKTGAGNWTLSAANTNTGSLTVNRGTLILSATAAGATDIYKATGAVIFNADGTTALSGHLGTQSAGGILQFNGFTGGSQEALGALTATAGHGQVVIGGTTTGSTLTFASLGTRTAGATLDLAPGGTSTIGFTATVAGTNGIFNGATTLKGVDFVAAGTGPFNAAAPTYTTLVAAGSSTTNYILTTGTVALSAAAAMNSLKLTAATGTTQVTLNGVNPVTTGGVLFDNTGTGSALITGGTQLGAAATEVIVTTNGTGTGSLTIASPISSTTGSLTKAGTGTLILSGNSAFTGNVNINQGTVQLSGATARVGTSQAAATVFNVRQGATFDLNGAGASSTIVIGALNGAGTITNTSGSTASTLVIGNGATTTVANAAFTGTITNGAQVLNLTKDGTGVQYLTGANSYTGVTTINRGTLAVTDIPATSGNNTATTNLTTTVGSATATVASATGLVVGQTISGNSNLAPGTIITGISGTTLTLSQTALATSAAVSTNFVTVSSLGYSSNAASNLVFNGGTLQYTGSNATIARSTGTASTSTDRLFTIATGANATIDSSGTVGNSFLAAGVANNAALVFTNTGDIAFSGAASAHTLTLRGTSIGDNELRPRISDQGTGANITSLTKADAGLWILNPATSNSYTGTTTVSGGALQVAAEGAAVQGLPTNSLLTLNGGVIQTSGNFTRTIGSAAGNVQLTGGASGFAASSSSLTVNINSGAVTWGGATFNPTSLVLNSTTALSEVIFQSTLDLGGAARTIQVDDNLNTSTDLATITGVISNGSLNKTGTGILQLMGANTYTGNTAVQAGTLVATTFGNATPANGTVTTSSSLGANGGQLQLGATTVAGVVNYVGAGEVSDRVVSLVGTTAGGTITSDGYGPLVLTSNLAFANGTAAKTLTLQGYNSDVNEFRGVIANEGAFATVVTKTQGGTWILSNPGNTFSGGVTLNAGMLGVADNAALGTGTLTMNANASLYAAGGDRTFTNNYSNTGGELNVVGENSITFSGTNILSSGGNRNLRNTLAAGKTLTLGGIINIGNSGGTGRTAGLIGPGTTILSGQIIDGTTVASAIAVNALGGNVQFNNGTSTYTGTTTLTAGTVTAGATGTPFGSGTIAFNTATLTASTPVVLANTTNVTSTTGVGALLTGTNSFEFSGLFGNVAGNQIVTNNLSGGATLTLGQLMMNTAADTTARTFTMAGSGNSVLNGSIQGTAAVANNLTYSNSGTLSVNTTSANGSSGTFAVNNGIVSLAAATQTAMNFSAIQLNGGTLSVDNQTNGNVANRLGTATALNLNGGSFTFTANTASGSTQNFGGTLGIGASATSGGGASTITFNNAGSSASTLTFTTLTPNQGGTLNLAGTATLGATNKITFSGTAPTLSPVSTGILARVTVGGTDFATYDVVNSTLAAFTAYNNANNIDTASVTDTLNITANPSYSGLNGILPVLSNTVNGIKLNGNALTISAAQPTATLAVTSGGLISTGATATGASISVPVLAFGSAEALAHIDTNSGLATTISSAVTGSGGFTKSGNGTLTLSGQLAYTGQTTVNKGTLNLNSSIGTLPTATVRTPSNLAVNEGGTLNLGVNTAGNIQVFGSIQSTDPLSGKGGTINNAAASTVNLVSASSTSTTFGGSITDTGGDLSFYKQGAATLTLTGANTYTGSTTISGGGITLRDSGTLASTSINVGGGTLLLDNAGLTSVAQRIPTNATVNLRGGTLTYAGAINSIEVGSVATTGGASVNALSGANTITATIGTAANTDLVIGNLVRTAGQGTVNFTSSGTTGTNGQGNGRITLNQINGVAPTNGQFIGAWATVGNNDYATYFNGNGTTSTGVGAYDAAGFNTYTTYSPTNVAATYTVPTGILASGNISNLVSTVSTTVFQMPGALNVTDALRIGGGFTTNVSFANATDVLNLQLGGLLRSNNANTTSIGATAGSGILTAGTNASTTTELIVYNNQSTLTINSVIRDTSATTVGGSGTVSLVKSGAGTVTLAGNNNYTAGTTVQQGTLTLSTASANGTSIVSVPGNLTINNGATVNFGITTANSQIATSSNITINGGGTLTLPNYSVTNSNTWNSLTFNSNAGSAVPTVGFGTPTAVSTINLSAANAITVTNDNFSVTPLIAAAATAANSALRFTNTTGATVINVGGMAPEGLQITAPITTVSSTSGLEKTGVGGLILAGANTYNNAAGLKLVDGSLILSNAAALGANTSPLVIGDTTVANTVPLTIMVGATAYTGTNPVTVNRDFTFGGLNSTNNLALAGAVTLAGAGARTITVTSPAVTGTITGTIGGSVGLIKNGVGTLALGSTTNTNNYSGATSVSAGTLQINVAEQIPDASALTVATGAVLNLNGLSETVGSLTGGGLILNPSGTATLSTGGDNASTTFSGIISNSTGAVLNFAKTGTGMQTLSAVNTYSGNTTITNGTVQLGIAQALPNSLAGNSVTFNPASGTATLDLNGFSQTLGALTSSGAGTSAIDNTAATAATLTVGSLNQTVNFGGNLTNSGGGALALTKTGTAAATLSGATISHTGLTTVSGGSLSFTNATAPGLTGGVSISGGATLNLNNTAGNVINMGSGTLNLGAGGGTTILGFDLGLGDANPALSINDSLTTSAAATVANTIQFNLTAISGFTAGTFNLLAATSGLTSGGATYVIGSAPSGFNFAFNNTDSLIQLIATVQQDRYWKGLADSSWNTVNIASNFNWSDAANGSTDFNAVPSGTQTVNFSADNAAVSGGGAISTTLDGNVSIGNLKFLAGTNTTPATTSTTIAQGSSGTLTLTPSSASDGILVNANAGPILISSPVAVGSNQTWSVASTGASLEVSGAVSGGFGITKADTGTLTLSGTAANTFTGNTIVNAGTMILNKTAVDAIAAGTLQIGDSVGANDADVVQLNAADQINNVVNVDVRSTGLFNLNGNNETIAGLILQSDVSQGASVTTGAGVLSLGGNVTLNANGTGATGADITGSLNLNDAARTFTIAKGSGNVTADLVVAGAISSTTAANGSVIKNGLGTLAFTGAANTYTGNTTVNAGVLALSKSASTDSIAGGILQIGDSSGGNDADIVILTTAEQINNSVAVDVRSSGLFTLNGNAETIASLALESDSSQGASVTTGAGSLILGGNVTHTANGTGAVNADITGSVNLNDSARTFSVAKGTGNTTFDLDVAGAISSTTAASGSLVKDGAGVMRLSGAANTYTGNTTVNAGTLLLSKAAATNAVAGGTLIIGDSAGGNDSDIVRLGAADQIANTVNVDVRSSGLFSLNGNNETVNVVTLQSDDTSGATITTGAGTLALSSNVNLNANNTGAVGADIVGNLNLNNAIRTFTIADGTTANTFDLDVNGVISSTTAASGGITKAGAGTLRFTGAANTYTGLTRVDAGTLLLSKGAGVNAVAGALTIGDGTGGDNADVVRTTANEQLATAALIINSTGFLDMTGNTETIGALTMQADTAQAASLAATTLILGGNVTGTTTGTGAVGADIVSNVNLNDATRTFTIAKGTGNTTSDLDITGVISSTTASSGLITKTGAGTLRLSGATSNSYTGLTTVSAGTLQLNKSGTALAISSGNITIGSASDTIATVQYTGTSTNMMGVGTVTINGRGQLDFNGGTDTIGDVAIVSTGATATNTTAINNTAGGGNLTIGLLGITPAAGIDTIINTGTGGGTLTLGGTVTFTAATTGRAQITGETLALGANRTFAVNLGTGTTYDLDISSAITGAFTLTHSTGGRLQFSGSTSNTYSGATTVAGTGSVLLLNKSGTANALAGNLTVGSNSNNAATVQYTGTSTDMIANTAAVTINGRGVVNFNNTSDTIGNLALVATGASGTNTTPITNMGSSLTIGTLGITPVAGFATQVNLNGGTLNLGGTVTFTGATTGQAQISNGTVALGGNRDFSFAGTAGTGTTYDLEIQAAITGSGSSLTRLGTGGRLMFSGSAANTYDGMTNVNGTGALILNKTAGTDAIAGDVTIGGGILRWLASNQIKDTSNITYNSGSFDFTGGPFSETIASLTITAAPTFTGGSNNLNLTVTGAASLTGGATGLNSGTIWSSGSLALTNAASLTLNGNAATQSNWTVGAGGLSMSGQTISLNAASASGAATGARITLNGGFTATGTNTLTNAVGAFGAAQIDLGGAVRTFDITGTTTIQNNANLVAIQNGGITKTGTGTLVLGGANTYTGGTTINNGAIQYNASSAINSASAMTVNATAVGGAATLNLNGFNGTVSSLTFGGAGQDVGAVNLVQTGVGTLTLGGDVTTNATNNPTTANTITGNLSLGAADRTFSVADSTGSAFDLDVQALVSGTGGIVKTGAGTLALASGNTYTGKTTVNGGVVTIAAESALGANPGAFAADHLKLDGGTLGISSSLDIDDANRGITLGAGNGTLDISTGLTLGLLNQVDGTGGLTKAGAGTVVLGGTIANTYTGVTTVSAGVLELNKTGVNAIVGDATASKVTPQIVVSGGTLRLAANDQIHDNLFINVTSGSLDFNNRNETIYNLNVSGGSVNYGTGDITIDDPVWSGGTNTISGNTTFGFLNISGGTNTVTGTSGGGAGQLTIGTASTSGPLEFSGNNNTPTLNLSSDNTTAGRARFRAGSTIDLVFSGTGTSTGLIASTGSGSNAGELDLNGSTRTFNIGNASSAVDMTISAQIVATGGGGVTKTGAGTLALTAANTYTGTTTISAGVLQLGDGGTTGSLASGSIIVNDSSLVFNRSNSVIQGTDFTNSVISGTGSVTQAGTGTLVLAQANTYSGGTTVSSGTLNLTNTPASGSATGSGPLTIASGATLAGTGRVEAAANTNVYINGSFVVGDSTLGSPVASTFDLYTSGTGSTLLGNNTSMSFDLFTGAGLGDNSGTATAADFVNLQGTLDFTAVTTLVITNPNNMSSFAAGDKWKLFSFSGLGTSITNTFTSINDTSLNLGALGLAGNFITDSSGGYYIVVPEPSRALLLMFGILGLGLRRRRK